MNKIYNWQPVAYTYDQVGIMMIIMMTSLTPSIRQIVNHTTMPTKLKLDIARIWDEKCAPRGYTRYLDIQQHYLYKISTHTQYLHLHYLHTNTM